MTSLADRPPAEVGGSHGGRSVPWPLVGAVVVAIVRWLFGNGRRIFQVYADEPATMAMGRWLGGGTRWNLFDYGTRKPGFSVLLAPVYALTDDSTAVYRVALALNAVLAGASVVLLVAVLRRLTDWTTATATAVAVGVALAPASISASAAAWAEPLVTLTFLATLVATMRFVERRTRGSAVVAVVLASLLSGPTCSRRSTIRP